jgi:primase-polymerase (primpol)-like protein
MSETVRVYINANPVDVNAATTALQAVEAWDETQAVAVRKGERMITDSRGIITANDTPVHNGAIFRIVRARQAHTDESDLDPL